MNAQLIFLQAPSTLHREESKDRDAKQATEEILSTLAALDKQEQQDEGPQPASAEPCSQAETPEAQACENMEAQEAAASNKEGEVEPEAASPPSMRESHAGSNEENAEPEDKEVWILICMPCLIPSANGIAALSAAICIQISHDTSAYQSLLISAKLTPKHSLTDLFSACNVCAINGGEIKRDIPRSIWCTCRISASYQAKTKGRLSRERPSLPALKMNRQKAASAE